MSDRTLYAVGGLSLALVIAVAVMLWRL